MDTEELNKYIFASLVAAQANNVRLARIVRLSNHASDEEIAAVNFITPDDLREGLKMLVQYKEQSLKLLQESLSGSAE